MELLCVGTVARLQIQRSSLKVGQKPHRVYDTAPLLSVERMSVSSDGAIALLPGGQEVIDVHHREHPQSQYADVNGLSIGFTSHYARMRACFGDHVFDGCAGENVLIDTSELPEPSDVERGVMIRCAVTGVDLWLRDVRIALPCLEFSRFALRLPQVERESSEVKRALQFLEHGTRGYYVTPANPGAPVVVSLGDRVYLPL
jgi:hypothetical protein